MLSEVLSIISICFSVLNLIILSIVCGKVFFSTHRAEFLPVNEFADLQNKLKGKPQTEQEAFDDELQELDDVVNYLKRVKTNG